MVVIKKKEYFKYKYDVAPSSKFYQWLNLFLGALNCEVLSLPDLANEKDVRYGLSFALMMKSFISVINTRDQFLCTSSK